MKTFTLLLFLGIFLNSFSQDVPLIKIGEDKLGITKLDLNVEIVGNIVTTTYDMKFYNPTNNILEGELIFPLGENQSVSRFALDVNGKLREAVVVEKEQGRIAFEAVVRRRVDPALLEKGTGNNYRARIYPIPAKGYKQIVIAYEEELEFNGVFHQYTLDQSFKNELETYNVSFKLLNQKSLPQIISNKIANQNFSFNGKDYELHIRKNNYRPNEKLVLKIPYSNEIKINRFNDFIYVYKTLNNKLVKKEKPKKIKLLWDTSLSMKGRDLEKEI
jgi:hypothetical protein